MRLKNLIVLTTLFALLCLLPGAQNAAAQGTIKIGVITSLTGSQAAFGGAHKNGYQIALDEINAKGGVLGKQVELDYYDDQSKPDQAVQGVSKLVDQDHVSLLLGAYSSENTKAIINPVTTHQIPLLIPTATADNVMDSKSPWVFRICAGASDYAKVWVDFLKKNGNPKTMVIVYEKTNFGQANMQAMKEAAAAAGITVLATEEYEAKAPDYKAVLRRVKDKNPDVIYFCSYLLDATTLMRQSQEVDLNPRYFTAAGTGFSAAEFPTDKGAGKNAEYTLSVSQWLPEAPWPGSKEFDAEYFKRTNTHPQYHAMQAYQSLMTAVQAIKNANSLEAAKVRDALKNINLKTSAFGPVKFDANGQNLHQVLITQIQGGKYKVVFPADVADAKPIIPAPKWADRK
ncbi:MAG TPA: ABC transporter substrate-binding protein [Candidatus Angelobacter sp.]